MSAALYPADLKAPEFRLGMLKRPDRYQHELDYVAARAGIRKPMVIDSWSLDVPHAGVYWRRAEKRYAVLFNPNMLDRLTPAERLAVLAHEVGHVACAHPTAYLMCYMLRAAVEICGYGFLYHLSGTYGWWVLLGVPLQLMVNLFVFGLVNTYRRRSEYQADRQVHRILGAPYLMALMSGIYKCEQRMEELVYNSGRIPLKHRGWKWWVFSTHPTNVQRCSALGIKTYEVFSYLRTQREAA